jgi:Ssp1 endopeptidase immunity protein Rap1a
MLRVRWLSVLLFLCLLLAQGEVARRSNQAESLESSGNAFAQTCSKVAGVVASGTANVRDQDLANAGLCTGYLAGLADGIEAESNALLVKGKRPVLLYCAPKNVERGQEVEIVLKYIREHPEKAHIRTAGLATIALTQAFPCPKR